MRFSTAVLCLQLAAGLVVLSMIILKIINLKNFKDKNNNKGGRLKLVGWFNAVDVMGTTSPSRRDMMQRSNYASVAIWICLAVLLVLFLIPAAE